MLLSSETTKVEAGNTLNGFKESLITFYKLYKSGKMILMGSEDGYKNRSEAVADEISLLNEELEMRTSDAQAVLSQNTADIFKQ